MVALEREKLFRLSYREPTNDKADLPGRLESRNVKKIAMTHSQVQRVVP